MHGRKAERHHGENIIHLRRKRRKRRNKDIGGRGYKRQERTEQELLQQKKEKVCMSFTTEDGTLSALTKKTFNILNWSQEER